jgi:hypothetical protein
MLSSRLSALVIPTIQKIVSAMLIAHAHDRDKRRAHDDPDELADLLPAAEQR